MTRLEKDEGFCRVLRRVELLEVFHDAEQEKQRISGKAFIPVPNEHLRGLARVNKDLVGATQKRNMILPKNWTTAF